MAVNFKLATALSAAIVLGAGSLGPGAHAADFTSTLRATAEEGTPEGIDRNDWLQAQGEARATAEGDEHVVEFTGSNLVPDGLYTFWWVNPGVVMTDMGPGGGVPENEFRADADGNAETTIRVPADNDYQRMVIAYHADDQTHGDEPGEMGEITFEHLSGAWPGPAGR